MHGRCLRSNKATRHVLKRIPSRPSLAGRQVASKKRPTHSSIWLRPLEKKVEIDSLENQQGNKKVFLSKWKHIYVPGGTSLCLATATTPSANGSPARLGRVHPLEERADLFGLAGAPWAPEGVSLWFFGARTAKHQLEARRRKQHSTQLRALYRRLCSVCPLETQKKERE